ncbi:MAG: hypothetical protein HY721_29720, partial [Planctomycetes bacterium]|nr:hypothetical protein [Planctomycetota bacterium]
MTRPPLTGSELIPDVVRCWPSARAVLDRYGLQGCGGPLGPAETLAYFARAHGVDLPRLLAEIEDAIASAGAAPAACASASDPAAAIYRRFFLGGIVATLTAGATWGAYLLLKLGFKGSFEAVTPHEVNAHGHAQVFGWVGLFVMGFAYQAFPRFKHGRLRRPRLAFATFPLYVGGLVLRTAGEALHPSEPLFWAGLGGSALEITAVGIFAWIVAETLLVPEPRPGVSDRYILAATGWFLLQAVYDAGLYVLTSTAASAEELIQRIATFQVPLRDMQIHGFATLMIFGVSQRYLPGMIGLRRVPERLADALLAALNLAILGEIAGFLGRRTTGSMAFAVLL